MIIKNKKVLVYGLGESGFGAIELLQKKKAKVFVFDDDMQKLEKLNLNVTKINAITENFLSNIDLIVLNPSVSIYSENLALAQILGKKIISEIELAFLFSKGKIISVTGSNGKSTTASLIFHILKLSGQKTSVVGNIGNSFSKSVCKNPKQTFVVEVSSFQLETCQKYNSKIACFLNFCENHLDRHFSLKEYFNTKKRIFKNQKRNDFCILNFDDEKVKEIKTKSKTYYFSLKSKVKGCYVFENKIYFCDKTCEEVLSFDDIKLKGEHNLQNVLCAVLVAKLMKIKNQDIKSAVSSFFGLAHRIEFVEKIDNISFYNDSKSTTVKSTQTALKCFDTSRVLLILGGSDKNCDFGELFPLPNCVKKIFAVGKVKNKILLLAKQFGFLNVQTFDDFKIMVSESLQASKNENLDVVLLSPATASFDMFKNFEERGDTFKNLVKELNCEKED
ncbi:MAG: UDP-N-acetylmuramoyl-L-alanine--D-glutamate ligase [Christensenellales bacterium]